MRFRLSFRAALILVCLAAISTGTARANDSEVVNPTPKPATEHRFNRKFFFAETAALGLSSAFDWTTSVRCFERGCVEASSRWAIGSRPSESAVIRYGSAWFAADTAAAFFTEKSRNKWVRWAGRMYIGYVSEGHIAAGLRNQTYCHPKGVCVAPH
jgi:hypothetical protein